MAAESKGLRVIGAGFGRTGTARLQTLFNALGLGPCLHGNDFFDPTSPYCDNIVGFWEEVADARDAGTLSSVNWDKLFSNPSVMGREFRSGCDWPVATFWKEISEFYPSCKVVLSIRDPDKWHRSMVSTIAPPSYGFDWLLQYYNPFNNWLRRRINSINRVVPACFNGFTGFAHVDPAITKKAFLDHIEEVKKHCPKEKLYVLDLERTDQDVVVQELAAFLETELPSSLGEELKSGKRVNNTDDMQQHIQEELDALPDPFRFLYPSYWHQQIMYEPYSLHQLARLTMLIAGASVLQSYRQRNRTA